MIRQCLKELNDYFSRFVKKNLSYPRVWSNWRVYTYANPSSISAWKNRIGIIGSRRVEISFDSLSITEDKYKPPKKAFPTGKFQFHWFLDRPRKLRTHKEKEDSIKTTWKIATWLKKEQKRRHLSVVPHVSTYIYQYTRYQYIESLARFSSTIFNSPAAKSDRFTWQPVEGKTSQRKVWEGLWKYDVKYTSLLVSDTPNGQRMYELDRSKIKLFLALCNDLSLNFHLSRLSWNWTHFSRLPEYKSDINTRVNKVRSWIYIHIYEAFHAKSTRLKTSQFFFFIQVCYRWPQKKPTPIFSLITN